MFNQPRGLYSGARRAVGHRRATMYQLRLYVFVVLALSARCLVVQQSVPPLVHVSYLAMPFVRSQRLLFGHESSALYPTTQHAE
mgnify:CR=1 FL=1